MATTKRFVEGENQIKKFSVSPLLVAQNRRLLVEELWKNSLHPSSIILLQGGKREFRGCSDFEPVFRQESYFHWAFGVEEPDFYGAIRVSNGNSILFFPRPSRSDIIFLGLESNPEVIKSKYQVDEVYFNDEMRDKLRALSPSELLVLSGSNAGEPCAEAYFDGIQDFTLSRTHLFPAMSKLRAYKTDLELDIMRYVNKVSSDGHIKVLQTIRPGMTEYQTESIFLNFCYYESGCRNVAYTCICGSGENGAILHYSLNNRTIQDGDMCLFDMGAEYYCYAADITMTFPANGKFTEDQKKIYNTVLAANLAVLNASRPAVLWSDMQRLSDTVILQNLIEYGIIHGNINEMLQANLQRVFCPHGLGHLLGVDVHDVGDAHALDLTISSPSNVETNEEKYPMYNLKSRRNPGFKMPRALQQGMVFTIEPGCYFIDFVLDEALGDSNLSRFLVASEIQRFRGFGGVRIEDNAIVTATGLEIITSVPKTIEEIEAVMAAGRKAD